MHVAAGRPVEPAVGAMGGQQTRVRNSHRAGGILTLGRRFANTADMARGRYTIDQRPGPAPEVQQKGDSVVLVFTIGTSTDALQLVVRCDAAGELWISIKSPSRA